MLSRPVKQTIISAIYILIITLIGFGFYFKHYAPSCTNGKQDGQEQGVDCGVAACGVACKLPVQPLQVQAINLIKTPAGDYDFAGWVYNPNTTYGIGQGLYNVVISSTTGQEVFRMNDISFYMLPGQTKYFVLTSIRNIPDGAVVRMNITSVQWVGTTGVVDGGLVASQQTYTPGKSQSTFESVITNTSNYDFDNVDLAIVVFDHSHSVIATNVSNLQTVLSHTDRYFKVTWPFALPADAQVYVQAGTNVFDNANFIKQHGTQENFQQSF